MAKKKSKNKGTSLIVFAVAVVLFVACLAVAIAFSVIPYGLTSYSLTNKTDDGDKITTSFVIADDYAITGSVKVNKDEPSELTIPGNKLNQAIIDQCIEDGVLTPFIFDLNVSLGSLESGKYVNGGNIAIVTIASVLAAAFLGLAVVKAKKAF